MGVCARRLLAFLLVLHLLRPATPNVRSALAFCPSPRPELDVAQRWWAHSASRAHVHTAIHLRTASGRRVCPGIPAVYLQAREVGDSGPHPAHKMPNNTSADAHLGNHQRQGLPDLRQLKDLNRVLEVVGRYVVNGTDWMLSPEDAAVSLHFLHRAARGTQGHRKMTASPFVVRRRQTQAPRSAGSRAGSQPRASASSAQSANRLENTMMVLSAAIARDLRRADSTLEPKHLSMALMAVSDRILHHSVLKDLFHLASKRVQDMVRARTFGHLRTRRDVAAAGIGQGVQREPQKFTAQTISMLATAFVKGEITDPNFFEALALLLKQMPPERLSPRPVGMILKSFARANTLAKDAELLRILCSVLATKPIEDFDVQSCTDIVFALARVGQQGKARGWEGDARDEALQHTVAAILALSPEELAGGAPGGSPQAVSTLAALCSALVSARVTDVLVFDKLSLAGQSIDPTHWSVQTIATMMHAFASAGHSDKELVHALTNQLLRTPLRSVEARAAANIAWCAAVQESRDPALLCWIWRSLDLLLPSMQADGLSQVHQFLLYAQIGNFTREDVFTAFYGTRVAPLAVRQTLNDMEESAEERCRREFIRESRAQCVAQRSSRLHEHVSAVLIQVAPQVLPSLPLEGKGHADSRLHRSVLLSRDVPATYSQAHSWLQHEVVDSLSGYSIDMLIPAHSIAIEVDGYIPSCVLVCMPRCVRLCVCLLCMPFDLQRLLCEPSS